MNTPDKTTKQAQDLSWAMLLSLATAMIGALYFLIDNVFYTEGEVMQGLFVLLVGLVAGFVLIGFYRRKTAAWCVIVLGGALLLWQTYQCRKWMMIHEDIVAIVRFVEDSKSKTGEYPRTLDGYCFKRWWVSSRIYKYEPDEAEGFRLTYFLNNPGITYWYSAKTGFGYYPD